MKKRSHIDHLDDICQACQKAIAFLGPMSLESFESDEKTTFAVIRALEIVGEAAKRIPSESWAVEAAGDGEI